MSSTMEASAAQQGAFQLTDDDVRVVSALGRWMRLVSTIHYAGAVLVLIVAAVAFVAGGAIIAAPMLALVGVIIFLSGTWLRKAAKAFQVGVEGSEETVLALGFGHLRSYLILYACLGLLGLAGQVMSIGM